jgi:hypothetical protein
MHKILSSSLLVVGALALIPFGVQTPMAFASAPPPVMADDAALESAIAAQRMLSRMGSPDIRSIRDADLRAAAQRVYDALCAVAANTSREDEAMLLNTLDRAVFELKSKVPATCPEVPDCDASYDACDEASSSVGGWHKLCELGYDACYLNWFMAVNQTCV